MERSLLNERAGSEKKYVRRWKKLDPKRYEHTLGVAYTAASLAMCYGADLNSALIAGMLHDCAKCLNNEKRFQSVKSTISRSILQKKKESFFYCMQRSEAILLPKNTA